MAARALDMLHGWRVAGRLGLGEWRWWGGGVSVVLKTVTATTPPPYTYMSSSTAADRDGVGGVDGGVGVPDADNNDNGDDDGLLVAHEFIYRRRRSVALTRRRVTNAAAIAAASKAVEAAARRSKQHIVLLGDERTSPWFRCVDLSAVTETFLPTFASLSERGEGGSGRVRMADVVLARTLLPAWGQEEAAAARAARRASAALLLGEGGCGGGVPCEVTRLDTFEDVRFDAARDAVPIAI